MKEILKEQLDIHCMITYHQKTFLFFFYSTSGGLIG